MRAAALALGFLLLAALLSPTTNAEDFRAVSKVNRLINIKESPQLAPGESGRFVFYFNSTYSVPVNNVTLKAGIYRYATIDTSLPVDNTSWTYPFPKIQETGSREWVWRSSTVQNGTSRLLNFTVLTAADSSQMPHGTIFSQSSYFVRFWLEFNGTVSGNVTRFRMASRGFFTDDQWNRATNATNTTPCTPPWCRGNVNLTILGVDGILPDSAFGVKEPIPRWPFYFLIVLAAFFLILAFLFWVEENPGTYPKVEAWWARTRGRLTRTIAPLRRKPPKS
jgi:hypothetical protein